MSDPQALAGRRQTIALARRQASAVHVEADDAAEHIPIRDEDGYLATDRFEIGSEGLESGLGDEGRTRSKALAVQQPPHTEAPFGQEDLRVIAQTRIFHVAVVSDARVFQGFDPLYQHVAGG